MKVDRAVTPEHKRAIIERLYAAWLTLPHLRLGQLICCAATMETGDPDPFYIEDGALVAATEVLPHG